MLLLRTAWILTTSILIGILVGIGGFTFQYAEGFSYLSDDPSTCVNCHIMRDQYDSWQKGPHHNVAVCNDCHIPHAFPMKYVAKGLNGYHHSKAFTLQNFHEPIMIKPYNARILQENCIRCHSEMVETMLTFARTDIENINCARCHKRVGH